MPPAKVVRAAVLALAVALLAAASAAGEGALVEVNDIVLRADGSFKPQSLPRQRYAPVEFQGRVDIAAKGGGRPSPLRQALIDFDRDGRLSVAGLPSCRPELIDDLNALQVRETCGGAIVGFGEVEVAVAQAGGAARARSELTVLNGPRVEGRPTVILHARFRIPTPQTYAIVVPIERLSGGFRYRARIDLPPLAGGLGALTHIDVKIGRRYRAAGQSRSYVSARCSDNVLQTHGRFSFEDGTVISGLVEKYCQDK
jgi:hypothetical protein